MGDYSTAMTRVKGPAAFPVKGQTVNLVELSVRTVPARVLEMNGMKSDVRRSTPGRR
jgi:hypothetical protein